MKLLIQSINYTPELTGIGKFSGEMGAWLAARGHQVRVVTTPPYYPEWKIRQGYRRFWYGKETLDGVEVWRCPFWVPRRQSGLRRIIHLASHAASALPVLLWQALVWRPDIVCIVKPPAFSLPGGLLAAFLGGARSWLHVQDFEIDAAFDLGLLHGARLRRLALGSENRLMRGFDLATSISPRMLDRLRAKGIAEARSALFPNWADLDRIQPLSAPSPYREMLGLGPDTVVALYSGNMGEKQGLETMVDAARALSGNPDIHFVLCGEGAGRSRLEAAASGLSQVHFLPLQPLDRLNALLNLADVHLLPQKADAADLVMPSKLGGMLATGRPVIAGAHAGTQVAETVDGAGIVVAPDDGAAMAGALADLAADPARRQRLGAEARRRALEDWHRDRILARLEQRLHALASS